MKKQRSDEDELNNKGKKDASSSLSRELDSPVSTSFPPSLFHGIPRKLYSSVQSLFTGA